jgi:hypothetical protein
MRSCKRTVPLNMAKPNPSRENETPARTSAIVTQMRQPRYVFFVDSESGISLYEQADRRMSRT